MTSDHPPTSLLPPVHDDGDSHADDQVKRLKAMTTSCTASDHNTNSNNNDNNDDDDNKPTNTMGELGSRSRQFQSANSSEDRVSPQRRPSTPRAQTEPSLDTLPTHHTRPRNRSPYARSHLRSHSGSSSLSAPPMTRAHSLPTVISASHLSLSPSPVPLARPSSPLRSPKRTRSPYRMAEESYSQSGAPSVCDISEDAELELTPRATHTIPSSPLTNHYATSSSLNRSLRRRPASPLHQVSVPFGLATGASAASTPTSTSSSPLLSATKFNEPFPGINSHYPSSLASSSVPSTPTSMRSRSPSISSLETIEDSPDAEEEAIEADRIARLKAAEEHEQNGEEGARRSSLDVPGERRGLGLGKRDSRKRWSVCGAERRGDLDLETIWED